jgi:cytidylate kinase
MKNLILICGPNGVGKSSACMQLVQALDHAAYIDSDWCRVMHPFTFNPETIHIIKSNIVAMMTNYFQSSLIENVIFQYGFHGPRKQIFDGIQRELHTQGISYQFCPILLTCDVAENIARMRMDGRDEERIQRALQNTRDLYDVYDYPCIDTTLLSVSQTVDQMLKILSEYAASFAHT